MFVLPLSMPQAKASALGRLTTKSKIDESSLADLRSGWAASLLDEVEATYAKVAADVAECRRAIEMASSEDESVVAEAVDMWRSKVDDLLAISQGS